MTMQTSSGVVLEFFDPTAPHKASSPALLFGYELILSVLGRGEVSAELLEQVERIARELEERGLLGTFRAMLENDRQEDRWFRPGAVQGREAAALPQDVPSEHLLFHYRYLAQKMADAKSSGDLHALEQFEAYFALVAQEVQRRDLRPLLELLEQAEVRRMRARGHGAN